MSRTDIGDWYEKRGAGSDELTSRRRAAGSELDGLRPPAGDSRGCISSSQCASGFGCVGGKCVKIGITGGHGSPISAGNCPTTPNDCNSGSYACQSSPTCGKGSWVLECCGGKKTYVFKPGYERRVEGECVEDKNCHYYCSSRYALFGPPDTDPDGLIDHCEGKTVCENADCEECDLFSGICEPKFSDRPCWCDGGESCGNCEACITNPADSNFGSCAPTDDSLNRCRQCVTLESYKCCGQDVGPLKVCSEPGFGGTTNDLRDKLKRQAKAKCSKLCTDCEQKSYRTYCSDTTGLPGNDLNCPDGQICKQTGSLSIAGTDCVSVEERDVSNCPFKPGRWVFNGIQSYHTNIDGSRNGVVAYRSVTGHFYQGDPENSSAIYSGNSLRNCADGGCYPVILAPGSDGFTPSGAQPPWGESLTVEAIEDGCTGNAFACGIAILSSEGQVLGCSSQGTLNKCKSVPVTDSGCARLTYYRPDGSYYFAPHFGPGCSISGTWTYEGPA